MKEANEFLLRLKRGDIRAASMLVLPNCPRDIRIDLIVKCLKNTPLRSHKHKIQMLDDCIIKYRNGKLSNLKLQEIISTLRPRLSDTRVEYTILNILTSILEDLRVDEWHEALDAVIILNDHYLADNYVRDLLFELSAVVWPQKDLMRVIYG